MLTGWQSARMVTEETETSVPIADVSAGSWTPSSGTDLFAMVADESDTTYIRSSSGAAVDPCTLQLPSIGTPDSGTITITIRHRTTP
jgi:hypothetical protein